ncbi:MAG: C40 family peptidase [Clostridia bacterium]|nr:C40 family peptidase [Clostridia bacterium]
MKQEFLAWLHTQVGQLYVWGGDGEEMTPALIRRMENNGENAARAIVLYEKRNREGKTPLLGYDCSGLISRFLEDHGMAEDKRNCNHLAAMCGTVYEMGKGENLRPADQLFRYDAKKPYFHVGVYVGEGMVIESKGRDEGVVKRPLNASGAGYWNRRGRLACFEREPYWGICTGGSVHFRGGPGREYASLGVIHKGDKLLVNPKEGWPQAAAVLGGELCVGYVSPQYLGEAEP